MPSTTSSAVPRANAPKIVYDRLYPPSTLDYAPIVHASNPNICLVASYPIDWVGIVRAAEIGLKTSCSAAPWWGCGAPSFMGQLSREAQSDGQLSSLCAQPEVQFLKIESFLKKYQERAPGTGTDPLGFYQPPFAYAAMQVLEQAITATSGLRTTTSSHSTSTTRCTG